VKWAGFALLAWAVRLWWRPPRPEGRAYEDDSGGDYVFCGLCRDWHPPNNCAGSWP
jgi:hypothetical protein